MTDRKSARSQNLLSHWKTLNKKEKLFIIDILKLTPPYKHLHMGSLPFIKTRSAVTGLVFYQNTFYMQGDDFHMMQDILGKLSPDLKDRNLVHPSFILRSRST